MKNGDKIVSLADARAIVIRHFRPMTEGRSVALAIEGLLKAAETGAFADRKAATDQVVIVLRARAIYGAQTRQ
jgi:hypothetical protein